MRKKSFYYVYNPLGGKPMFKHEKFVEALEEAERLAGKNKGVEFYVLEARCMIQKRVTDIEYFDSGFGDMPF